MSISSNASSFLISNLKHNNSRVVSPIRSFSASSSLLYNNKCSSYARFPVNDYVDERHYLSEVEAAILKSSEPLYLDNQTEIELNGQRATWMNRHESLNWRGPIPINEYSINEDPDPDIIIKRSNKQIEYIQELAIRYLRPPTQPPPGEIIITQQPNILTTPAPPIVVRQQPPRPVTPEPLVIREAPPPPPDRIGRKIITISGKRLPPPPRKVVIERLPRLPSKPQSVLIERWLPYTEVKRRVVLNKPNQADPVVIKPKNVIVQWEAPKVNIRKEYKYLGVIRANPAEYIQRYGKELLKSHELPKFVQEIPNPEGLYLACDYNYNEAHELYGDVDALSLVDLEKEGLSGYKSFMNSTYTNSNLNYNTSSVSAEDRVETEKLSDLVEYVFLSLAGSRHSRISIDQALRIILRVNGRLGKRYDENQLKRYLSSLDPYNNGTLGLNEFQKAFSSLAN